MQDTLVVVSFDAGKKRFICSRSLYIVRGHLRQTSVGLPHKRTLLALRRRRRGFEYLLGAQGRTTSRPNQPCFESHGAQKIYQMLDKQGLGKQIKPGKMKRGIVGKPTVAGLERTRID